jgi:Endomembrane protein 70
LKIFFHFFRVLSKVKLYVTKLTSTKTQMPYDYYSLPYCKPVNLGLQKENLGQVVSGDRVENSVYQVRMFVLIEDGNRYVLLAKFFVALSTRHFEV